MYTIDLALTAPSAPNRIIKFGSKLVTKTAVIRMGK
jgi:hypothetical protein